MYRVIECLTQEHDHRLVAVALFVCVLGSCLSVIIVRRVLKSDGPRQIVQLVLGSLITGATVWTTHFIAMLAWDPGFAHGYEPGMTSISLAVAIFGVMATLTSYTFSSSKYRIAVAGTGFGLTLTVVHYLGMLAYQLPGKLVWDPVMITASAILGVLIAVAAFHRITYPVTRYCWLGGSALMVLAICTMHFTGMAAFSVELSPGWVAAERVLPDQALGLVIFSVAALMFVVGFASTSIETNIDQHALAKLEHSASHDHLTGIPNRFYMTRVMADCTKRMARDQTLRAATLTIDLDLFKDINDVHGHRVGDAVLQTIAKRLEQGCQTDEFVARTGGDEFVALKTGFRRLEEVRAFAERLHGLITEPVETETWALAVGASVGIATTVEDGLVLDSLLQKSDLAMYRAKDSADNHICFYNAELDEQSKDRLHLISDLRLALSRGEFELEYQLQNDLDSLEPVGFEALLRWNNSRCGRISPAEFIPIAEETGLIRDIGRWVLETACAEAAGWTRPLTIAVNVAPQQMTQLSFVEHLADTLFQTGLAPERLELEITEDTIIDDHKNTLRVMHAIKDMGVRIAMDDFGTGYSSLASLQAFPFDKIKIDRSFVQGAHENYLRAAIVRATVLLGKALEIPVLAEGVEEENELEFLRAEQCTYVQGFYFGRPKPVAEMRQITLRADDRAAS